VKDPRLPIIYVDADGCPVKQEIYRVARRHGLKVILTANSGMQIPLDSRIELVVVDDGFDAADDWIVEHVVEHDIVITADIPLASRCIKKDARVLSPRGRVFTEDSIGEALANREIQSQLREAGFMTGGPAPFEKRDRSRLLQRLDEVIQAIRRGK
jgi:uncharacterized protein YaiI (UPF0178 family)